MSTKQKQKAMAWKHIRRLTTGMTATMWESQVVGQTEEGKPIYNLLCRDRWGMILGEDVFRLVRRISRKWSVRIIVKCRANDKQEYVEETELEADDIKLDEFTEVFKEQKKATIDACNPQHIYDVGWIAKAIT